MWRKDICDWQNVTCLWNNRIIFSWIWLVKDFLNKTHKVLITKEKFKIFGYIKSNNLFPSNIKGVKNKP